MPARVQAVLFGGRPAGEADVTAVRALERRLRASLRSRDGRLARWPPPTVCAALAPRTSSRDADGEGHATVKELGLPGECDSYTIPCEVIV